MFYLVYRASLAPNIIVLHNYSGCTCMIGFQYYCQFAIPVVPCIIIITRISFITITLLYVIAEYCHTLHYGSTELVKLFTMLNFNRRIVVNYKTILYVLCMLLQCNIDNHHNVVMMQ